MEGSCKDPQAACDGKPERMNEGVACTDVKLSPRPSFLSQLLFLFVSPIVRHARQEGDVQPAQLYFPRAVLVDHVHGLFNAAWLRSLKAGKPDIVRAVVANSFWGLIWTGLLYAVSLGCQLVGPLVLQHIVAGLQCWAKKAPQCPTQADLYYYVIAIALAPLIQSLVENQMQYQLNVAGLKMRNGLMAAIYRKCLRLSNAALQSESTGRVVTLMSNDAQKVQEVMLAIHTLWGAPVLIIVILGLLYQQLGWTTFVGLIIVVVYSPISTKVSAHLISLRRSLMQWTDQRVGLMNEIINSMQMIKFMAWERPFKAAVMDVRSKEAGILKRIIVWQSIFIMLLFSGPVLMAVVVFAAYALTGHVFGPASAYTSLALFNLLRMPLAFLPIMITAVINALVALARIGDFLQKPESGLEALRKAAESTAAGHVKVDKGVFTWESGGDADSAYMQDISFEARPGTLTMVVGSVASGKTSLLSALIGQMERLQGTVAVGGRVAYVAQAAWIINDSVQENIIMGEGFEPSKYRVAAEASQLMPDLEMWPAGDKTEIGDRGVTLSGGQKARVSIARGVYADADTYLFDDPLAAVDTHVGRALFERCIRGVLRNKTVILVTNALQHLPSADNIIWMQNGRIRAQGKYQDLLAAGLNVSELHLDDRKDGSAHADSDSEFADSDDWQAGHTVSSEDEAADVPAATQGSPPSTCASSSSTGGDDGEASATSCSTPLPQMLIDQQQQASGVAPSSSDTSASGTGLATVMVSRQCEERTAAGVVQPSHQDVNSSANGSGTQPAQRHKAPAAARGEARSTVDLAAAGSVSAAALQMAASKASLPSSLSLVRLTAEANRNLTGQEKKEKGGISGAVLRTYITAAGGMLVAVGVMIVMGSEQASRVMTDTFLGWWATDMFHKTMWFYVGIYAGLGLLYSMLTFVRVQSTLITTLNASVALHNELLSHILRLPKTFFDTNPAGRVLNRFSKDIETMDSVLNQDISQTCNCFATYLTILVVISVGTQWFGLAVIPITIVYIILQRFYIPTARELQRLESVTRSPIYSKFSEALAGVATIRAYRREVYFTAASDALMELNAAAFVSQRAAAGWLALRLDLLGVVVILLTAVLSISGGISPALAGLCLVYALDMTRFLKYGTALAAKTESDFNSVERVVEYLSPPTEAPEETDPAVAAKLPTDWPATGGISVQQLVLRYRPGLPLVLRGVSFEVAGGDKVGLVGRTGSGKSSLLLALFRMVEPEAGRILVDGVDICTLGLRHLRSQMSIIPQEPFLFSGTVRSNLDPFDTYQEADLWRAVNAVGLKEAITALHCGLDAHVVDGGNNFSQGQKQLFCLARAILRNSRVLMLDEATASVDPETDALIQQTIRTSFASTTMLTVAHRLNTIMDADRVLVLDQGMLVESGEPHDLLLHHRGIFSGMVAQTGAASSTHLREVARMASFDRAASRTAPQLHHEQLRPQLRQQSEVLGRRYVDQPVVLEQQADEADSYAAGSAAVYGRTDSGLSRFGCQDPLTGYLAAGGGAYARELSLLQRNTAGGGVGHITGAIVRHLPGMAELNAAQEHSPVDAAGHGRAGLHNR